MKKLLVALCMTSLLAFSAHAGDTNKASDKAKKPELTAEQKALKAEILAKYDINKDGKLDKEEKAKISAEDKAKMEAAGLTHAKKPAGEKPAGEQKEGETK